MNTTKLGPKVSAAIVMASIEKDAKPLVKRIQDSTIQSTADFDKLAGTLSALKELAKRAKVEEQSITTPLNEALKATRAHFKPFTDMVTTLEAITKDRMTKFLDAQREKSRKLELALEDGTIKKVSTLVRKQTELEVTSEHAQIRKVWTLTVVDPDDVPRAYMVPNEAAIREAFKAGKNVSGCEWKQVDSIAI